MNDATSPRRRILIVDLYSGGHHAQYIEHLWRFRPADCELIIAVTEKLMKESSVLSNAPRASDDVNLSLVRDPLMPTGGAAGLVKHGIEHRRQVRKLIREHRPDHCLLMYFDQAQLSVAFDLRFDYPVGISGIYFRPSFHYGSLSKSSRSIRGAISDRLRQVILRGALTNPHLKYIFSLDPYAAQQINTWNAGVDAVPLPDGVDIERRAEHIPTAHREAWGVSQGRHIALIFGVIDSRKGVFKVLRSLEQLDYAEQQRLCLALIGPQADDERDEIEQAIAFAVERTAVQVVVDNRFIQQDAIPDIFSAADSILITYQRHVGSSNVLVHAAAAGKPVIGSDYGLVGAYLRRHRLGLAIDSTSPAEIAKALRAAAGGGLVELFDVGAASEFASLHTSDNFARTIYSTIMDG